MTHAGAAVGLLVESHDGRPTKIEGNPDHPASLGATDIFHQTSVLTLYDPDRAKTVTHLGQSKTWSDFSAAITEAMERQRKTGGRGLRLLSEDGFALAFDAGGTMLRVQIVPHVRPAGYTVLGWSVPDIR